MSPPDDSPRPLAQKVLERPELLACLRTLVPDHERSFIAPYNVGGFERDLALALDVPIYRVDHRFAEVRMPPVLRPYLCLPPLGVAGIRNTAELADALMALRAAQPGLEAAVVKLDDGVYGDGNRVVNLRGLPPSTSPKRGWLSTGGCGPAARVHREAGGRGSGGGVDYRRYSQPQRPDADTARWQADYFVLASDLPDSPRGGDDRNDRHGPSIDGGRCPSQTERRRVSLPDRSQARAGQR
ncbi:MAG: hypothetical protein ACRDTH_25585 [Pseudonocardiaceae bacterium]